MIGRVERIRRYPVKSMGGESLETCEITWHGLIGDHVAAVTRLSGGIVITAKRKEGHPLLLCSAQYSDSVTEVTLPGGQKASLGGELDQLLSELLRQPVQMELAMSQGEVDRATNYGFYLRPGVFYDSSPLHILSTSSRDSLANVAGATEVELRARPQLIIATPGAKPFCENSWIGRCIRIGKEVVIFIRKPTERCPLPTAPQTGMPSNPAFLRAITTCNDTNLGVYAVVVHPGEVKVKDEVSFV